MNAENPPDALPPSEQPPPLPLAAALRLIGLGFLLGAILAGVVMWLLRRPEQPPIVLQPPPTAERPYEAVEDLERISGIGPSAVATLTPLVKVSD